MIIYFIKINLLDHFLDYKIMIDHNENLSEYFGAPNLNWFHH